MKREQGEKSLSESPEFSDVRQDSAKMEKTALCDRQDAEARAIMYRFLAAVYLIPPSENLLRHVMDEDFLKELSTCLGEEAVAELRQFTVSADLEEAAAFLKQEYMDLFAVPTGRYVIPFEDVYSGEIIEGNLQRGPLMGQRVIAVRKIYRQSGAQMDKACKELPTHIGVELSFMSFLCQRQAENFVVAKDDPLPDCPKKDVTDCTHYRKLQIRFLQNHLNAWFPKLCQSIQVNAKTKFYRGLASITAAFLMRDTANLLARSVRKIYV